MAEPLSTPCPVDAPPTNGVIAHTIMQGEDDVRLLNDPIALFSRDYEANNGNIPTLMQSFVEDNIPGKRKRKDAPCSPLSTAPSMMPSPRRKRQTQPVASHLLVLPFW